MPEIISRATWGARYRAGFGARPVGKLEKWLHHSVTPAPAVDASLEVERSAMRTLENIGQSRFGGGVSYTFGVMPSGRIYEGTGVARVGAHTAGRNTGAAGIVLIGNYETDEPTSQMIAGTAALLRHGVEQGWWATSALNGGHRDVKATSCPGRHAYARIGEINALAAVSGGGGFSAPVAIPAAPAAPSYRDCTALQRAVRATPDNWWGPDSEKRYLAVRHASRFGGFQYPWGKAYTQSVVGAAADGIWGPKSIAAHDATVRAVQAAVGASVDGIWGPQTERLGNEARAAARKP